MAETSKQEQVIELVKAGKSTRDEIRETVGCTAGSLASYLSTMSNIAKYSGAELCPITDEDGKMTVTTYEKAEAARAARGGKSRASAKSPADRLKAAKLRITRTTNAAGSAATRLEADPDNEVLQLRVTIADANKRLAEIEFETANTPDAQEALEALEAEEAAKEEAVEVTGEEAEVEGDDELL